MRKFVIMLLVAALCVTMVCPVLADEGDFVPSITYKPVPEFAGTESEDGQIVGQTQTDDVHEGDVYLIDGELYVIGEAVHADGVDHDQPCLVVTPLSEIMSAADVPDESREKLQWVYEQILELGMDFFADCEGLQELITANLGEGKTLQDLVVKDLFDVSVLCDPLEEFLEPTGTTLCLDFDAHVEPGTFVTVLTYKGGKWNMIEDVKVLEDGSVTCDTFENFCPVVILAEATDGAPVIETVNTGDPSSMGLWLAVAAASLVAIVLCVAGLKKSKKDAA